MAENHDQEDAILIGFKVNVTVHTDYIATAISSNR